MPLHLTMAPTPSRLKASDHPGAAQIQQTTPPLRSAGEGSDLWGTHPNKSPARTDEYTPDKGDGHAFANRLFDWQGQA